MLEFEIVFKSYGRAEKQIEYAVEENVYEYDIHGENAVNTTMPARRFELVSKYILSFLTA